MNSFIIKGDICYSTDKDSLSTIENGYLVCENGLCKGAFSSLPECYSHLTILNYSGKLIIPGLVDLHLHAPQYAFCGLSMDMELLQWLDANAFPEESKYTDLSYADKAYSIFCDSLSRSATTRACIFATLHKEATTVLMDKMENSGIVSFVGKVNMDRNSPDILREENARTALSNTEEWILSTKDKYANTKPILTPRFVPSCTDELMYGLGELQKKYSLAVQSHLSENMAEIELVKELCPDAKSYGDAYHKAGLFGKDAKTLMAHCVHSSPDEVELMKENGVFVVHCPASNTNLYSGIAPIKSYLDNGLKVGLGSDVAGGESLSLFKAIADTIKVSKLYHRLVDNSIKPLKFDEAFYIATKGGGEFFGKVGSFEEDFEFDAVVIDDSVLPHPQKLSVKQRLERSIYLSADLLGIKAKFVRGKKIL